MIKNFYKIQNFKKSENILTFQININYSDDIFLGHFPSKAVVPGAYLLNTVKDILCNYLSVNIIISKINSIKYLNTIEPPTNDIDFIIKLNNNSANCIVKKDSIIFCKMEFLFDNL